MPSASLPIVIITHGGAGAIQAAEQQPHQHGAELAAAAGWDVLAAGGSALDAVETAIRLMEDDPAFDAGYGSVLTSAGQVEMDAGIMDGASLKLGAVGAIKHYANPITLARCVMAQSEHHFLVGDGAEQFAAAHGFKSIPNDALIVERERARYEAFRAGLAGSPRTPSDTVGALALDARGNLAAANSTGGRRFKLPGRVGDSPLPGAGFYADNRFGAVACTGVGEHIMRVGLAFRAMQCLEAGQNAAAAALAAIELLGKRVSGGQAGLIVLDASGHVGVAHSTPFMAWACRCEKMTGVLGGIHGSQFRS